MTKCTRCKNTEIIKKGKRKTKLGSRQLYYCKSCRKGFADSKLQYKTYGPKVIVSALIYYNLGSTLEESAKLTNKRFKVKISKSSVSQWLKEFSSICTYCKLREKVSKNYGKKILVSKTFTHSGLAYNFKYHRPKLEILCSSDGLQTLKEYIENFSRKGCPEFFNDIKNRCSQTKIKVKIKTESRYNNACKLSDLALKSCSLNSKRYLTVENFMLANDSSTISIEVPVWFWEKNLNIGMNGHTDILQIRQGKIFVLDFKPEATRENELKVSSQLYLYALGLLFRT
ncbi:MAG: IS1 family transposase [Actinobacteria bacterium]|nr:IS1 family transposase [Actinomycetota bacterium]